MTSPRRVPARGRGVVIGLGAVLAIVLLTAVIAAVTRKDGRSAAASPTTTTTTTTAAAPATTTTAPGIRWPGSPGDGSAKAVVTPNGVVLAVSSGPAADGTFEARSPCGTTVAVRGTAVTGADVVIDPGHGGDESGAIGPGGTKEKVVNLAVALLTKQKLEALGARVVLTRTADYRVTLASRAAIATSLHPALFLSIHHNAEPDGPRDAPGSETYYQVHDASSKRAAGLVYEEVVRAFSTHRIAWMADTDAGAKYRTATDGGDYYGILRRSAGIPAVLSEAAFLSNPPEEALLVDPAFQDAEAGALARAVVRFVTTSDPGSGFVTPYPRTEPAGNGGGPNGCVDPPLG